MEKIKLNVSTGEYTVSVGEHILPDALTEYFRLHSYDMLFLVTDSQVNMLWKEEVCRIFAGIGQTIAGCFVFPAGEQSKTLTTVSQMYTAFAKAGLTRRSLVIALGGGVCGDMAGFAAATWLRGVAVLQIPTTLLAQVDSSVGGKTGVDLPVGKNLVGAFHQPSAVIADKCFLSTLPERFVRDGMAEILKCGCIADAALFEKTKRSEIDILSAIAIKAKVVNQDEHESGLRKILNYGHTIGHAVELLGGYSRFTHGESVGIGMLYAAKIGEKIGFPPLYHEIFTALQEIGLPTVMDYPPEALAQTALSDKKRDGDTVSMIFLDGIGKAVIRDIPCRSLVMLLQ